jgi:hypothetical protein
MLIRRFLFNAVEGNRLQFRITSHRGVTGSSGCPARVTLHPPQRATRSCHSSRWQKERQKEWSGASWDRIRRPFELIQNRDGPPRTHLSRTLTGSTTTVPDGISGKRRPPLSSWFCTVTPSIARRRSSDTPNVSGSGSGSFRPGTLIHSNLWIERSSESSEPSFVADSKNSAGSHRMTASRKGGDGHPE